MQRLDKESIQTAVSLEIYINPRLKMYQTLPSFLQNFFSHGVLLRQSDMTLK